MSTALDSRLIEPSIPDSTSHLEPDPIPTLVFVDPSKPGAAQKNIHTRWHPEIPCIASIPLSQPFKVQCLDYSGSQVHNDDNADDILHLNHDSDHHVSGPFDVPSARPGDVLEVEILDVRPFEGEHKWGWCCTAQGLGSLDADQESGEGETRVTKSIWDFDGDHTSSRHVPHVKFKGRPHPGILGTAPSHDLLAEWHRRESELESTTVGGAGVSLPKVRGAYVGQDLAEGLRRRIYEEGARTGPGREHGGNIDIGLATVGSKMYLPVYIPGASLSVGDLHFCQSDGEPTTAIEMAGIITLRVNIIPDGVAQLGLKAPMFTTSPSEPIYGERICFTGLGVGPDGVQSNQSGSIAYRSAAFQAISYLRKFGYTREQAYILLAAAPIESRVVATANKPNFIISIGIPLGIFDFDISPKARLAGIGGVKEGEKGLAEPTEDAQGG
ncbi:hypothetical protein IAR55_005954 [Kwoniella newhampshirensis]|uniref:Formamidase n=1 Tax=Kwoniella newhampshirensis TaxID=1651941 RepID=A0AAW0YHQ4_9TREE